MSSGNGTYRFILSGGGTGGHIYPAIAIANELKRRYSNAEFLFVGASDRMEMEKVPKAGYKIEGLWISGLQRKLSLKNLMFPFKLVSSLWRSRSIIKSFKPNVAIGTGGFASGPLLQVAIRNGIPALIQEQNSFPGITNKLLAKKANVICVAYEGLEAYFPKDKVILTGNPIRQDLAYNEMTSVQAKDALKLSHGKHCLLVLGGSLGSRRINQLIEEHLSFISEKQIELLWQCGSFYYDDYRKYNQMEGVSVMPFIDDMKTAYAAADIIISRSGAISVSELCVIGKPVLFIPSPNVAEDHQTKNAKAIADKSAAIYISESELDETFEDIFSNLLESEDLRKQLSDNIRLLAKTGATKDIVDEIEKLLR
ncbi:undecaprenyldiphospho-muramoylpentapeptide beta-N-acetylglucosaminyltransferase [Winogradskyella aurantiaca]|uniref:undecaprenyldiphospho-muramoylpentapeptide beta-N-acetylglucosaminyltransferase n=1 Tax=Winogradskyella aurantiaca TaxID=2219558 RepID=UPI000E1D4DDA|nr:undecaprenyldiphospho-muramoylpentapeptide beta-N-acetylglucosaminyltransferase [Winogradskyella aurantiaca]